MSARPRWAEPTLANHVWITDCRTEEGGSRQETCIYYNSTLAELRTLPFCIVRLCNGKSKTFIIICDVSRNNYGKCGAGSGCMATRFKVRQDDACIIECG